MLWLERRQGSRSGFELSGSGKRDPMTNTAHHVATNTLLKCNLQSVGPIISAMLGSLVDVSAPKKKIAPPPPPICFRFDADSPQFFPSVVPKLTWDFQKTPNVAASLFLSETLSLSLSIRSQQQTDLPLLPRSPRQFRLSGTGDSQRDSRESIRANHLQLKPLLARQADSHELLEFPIRTNHPICANRANRFARITPLRSQTMPSNVFCFVRFSSSPDFLIHPWFEFCSEIWFLYLLLNKI